MARLSRPAVMATTGLPSELAVMMPERRLAVPGPAPAMHTPGSPVTRDQPSAMWAAAASWRGGTRRTPYSFSLPRTVL